MYSLKALIIDDEKDAVVALRRMIEKHCNEITEIYSAYSVKEAIEFLNRSIPDLVFLDVELGDGNGFDVLRGIDSRDFETIFVTAHDHYSIKAFKFSAVDYLLKPVDAEELLNAVKRAVSFRELKITRISTDYEILFENLNSNTPKKFALPTSEGLEYIDIDEVILIKADGSYSDIVFKNGKHKLVAKVLKNFHERLHEYGFFRSHNSFLINLRHVKKLLKRDGGSIEMSDGTIAALSRKNIDLFRKVMKKYIYIS